MSTREQITEALFRFDTDSVGGLAGESYEAVADALMPLVERLRAEAAAEALETAADYHKRQMGTVGAFNIPLRPGDFAPWLRNRATALRNRAAS